MSVHNPFRHRMIAHLRDWWPAYCAAFVAAALRVKVLFSTGLMPQTDGAYYLAQVRSILAGHGLRFSDTPLLFWVQAAVAQGLMALGRFPLDDAVVCGVKIVDAVIPPLAVFPVYALWLRWIPRERRSILSAITVAMLPALSFCLVRMTGDLQKNEFALVLLSLMIWLFDTASASGRIRYWGYTVCALVACALAHLGVFMAALTFIVPAAVYRGMRSGGGRIRAAGHFSGFWIFCAGAVAVMGAALLVSHKFGSLTAFATSPLSLFSGENTVSRLAVGGADGAADALAVVLAYVPLLAAIGLWRESRPGVHAGATLVGALFATAILAFPLLGGMDGLRLHLMAYLPAAVLLAWAVGNFRPGVSRVLCVALLLANTAGVLPLLRQVSLPAIAEESYPELASLRGMIGNPENTVVVARHGLEWWAAWALDSPVVPTIGATPDLWERYSTVLLLQEKKMRSGVLPGPGNDAGAGESAGETPPVKGADVIYEGKWYRLSRADVVLDLGEEFEGDQRNGAAPRPRPPRP